MSKLTDAMKAARIDDIDCATANYAELFENTEDGDDRAWDAYEARAVSVTYPHGSGYPLLTFEDGSSYADWMQGIDRFYPIGANPLYDILFRNL